MYLKNSFVFFIVTISFLIITFWNIQTMAAQPLLQEGKKSVFQRAVTHPGAKLYASSEKNAQILRDPIKTFTVMYIYDKKNGKLQVGVGADKPDGWIDANKATEWPQAITMVFTDHSGNRDPVLFFRDHQSLEDICRLDDIPSEIHNYLEDIKNNTINQKSDHPVIASEPIDTAVSEKNFYLLPVLSIDDQFYELQGPRLIEVASINPGITENEVGGQQSNSKNDADFRTGIVFVIDTTISMRPYIDETLKLVRDLYNELEKSPYADKIGFAVVAYRSNVEKAPGIEYTTKVISDFTTAKNRKRLENALAQVKEATVTTHDDNEDAFAGVKAGVDKLSWDDYGSRVMVMITDAGPLGADNPYASTGFSPETLADYLRSNKIYLTALHIKNPKAKKNHDYAAQAYQALTKQNNNEASYIPLDASTNAKGAKEFEKAASALAKSYAKVAAATAQGKLLAAPVQQPAKKNLTPEEKARRIAESTGYAMQMQFFGNQKKATAPQVVKAWITDADLTKMSQNPNNAPVLAVEPAVLLTKGQLSNLYKQLKLLLEASETAFLNGDADLFSQIASAAAQMSSDPKQFSMHPDRNLAENGLLDEVLEGLPYKSLTGSMSRKTWEDMSIGQRDQFIKRLKSLIDRYEIYDKDSTNWESFGASNPADWVYRVPLSMLP